MLVSDIHQHESAIDIHTVIVLDTSSQIVLNMPISVHFHLWPSPSPSLDNSLMTRRLGHLSMAHRIILLKPEYKGVCQGYILSPCLFNLYTEYIMQNARLNDHKLELRLLGEVSTTSDMYMMPS